MNYIVTAVFVGSITYVCCNYQSTLTQQSDSVSPITNAFFPHMVLWTLCLAYFFGFFGISFVDTEAIAHSPSSFGLDEMRRQAESALEHDKSTRKPITSIQKQKESATIAAASSSSSSSSSSSTSSKPILKKTEIKHEPRNDTAICAEKPSVSAAVAAQSSADIDAIDFTQLSDEEVLEHLVSGSLKDYQLGKCIVC